MILQPYKAKSVMRKSSPGLFSWGEAYLNPYQGCYHDCVYCDGKSEGYYMHEDFSQRIKVKTNAPFLLEQFLRKKGFIPFYRQKTSTLVDFIPSLRDSAQKSQPPKFILHIGGGVCDVYQPAEAETRMTRTLLTIARDYGFPVFILTKNTLILRDLDILKSINENAHACCSFTITLADTESQKTFEPHASTTEERFEAIKVLRKEGIHAGIHFYPVLPFIGDTNANMEAIYTRAKEVGAEFVYCWGLTLKPGRNKQEFLSVIQEHYSHLLQKYHLLYGNNDKYGNINVKQLEKTGFVYPEIKGYKIGYEHHMRYALDRYVPQGRVPGNLKCSEFLLKISYIKNYILREKKVPQFYRAVTTMENLDTDVTCLSPKELEKVPVAREVTPYITEYLNGGRYLEELEEKAYHLVSARLKDIF
jgi:DNA repair photolyase